MTPPPALPNLPGLAWSRHKKPGFSTRVASHASGREVRVALMDYPLYEFETAYSGLTSASSPPAAQSGLGGASLQSLMGFFLQLMGQAGVFLYTDPDDDVATGQAIGVGDGATQCFVMGRTLGGFNEPVSWVASIANVYLNGMVQPSGDYVLEAPNTLAFFQAPGAGVAVSADFNFAFQCRFLDDQMDFEEFMASLWKLGSLKFRSVKANTSAAAAPPWYGPYYIGGYPSGTAPLIFADTTTEGGANHYLYDGATYGSFAALLAALSGTFSRSSSAYYTNASGLLAAAASNVLRFDHDGSGNPIGILVEGVSTNLAFYARDLTQSAWSKSNCTAALDQTGADGNATSASSLVATAANATCLQSITQASTQDTYSVYLKRITGSGEIDITLDGGTTWTNVTAQLSAGGYTRVAATETVINAQFGIRIVTSGDKVAVDFSQLEALAFASSPILTTSATASRSADSLSATPISGWYSASAGTLYSDFAAANPNFNCPTAVTITDVAGNNFLALQAVASNTLGWVSSGGGNSFRAMTSDSGQSAFVANTPAKAALSAQANNFAYVKNGGTPDTGSSGAMPNSPDHLYLTFPPGFGGQALYGHIKQFGYWNIAATAAQLQALTSGTP